MFSRQPRTPERMEIIYPAQNLTWHQDPAITAERRSVRRREMFALVLGLVLAAGVLGNAAGIAWLLSSVTEAKGLFIAGPG